MTTDELIQKAIDQATIGDKSNAKTYLAEAVNKDPQSARAWYLLSQVVDSREQAIYCLERVLRIQPNNSRAKERLHNLKSISEDSSIEKVSRPDEQTLSELPQSFPISSSSNADEIKSSAVRRDRDNVADQGVAVKKPEIAEVVDKQVQKTPKKLSNAENLLIGLGVVFVVCIICSALILYLQSTPTASPSVNVEELIVSAKQIPYDELARNTENHRGDVVTYRGKVSQVIEKSGQKMGLRVAVTEGEYGLWDDWVYVNYEGPRLLEDDIVRFWGTVDGRLTYTALLGNQITIPEITAIKLTRE